MLKDHINKCFNFIFTVFEQQDKHALHRRTVAILVMKNQVLSLVIERNENLIQ